MLKKEDLDHFTGSETWYRHPLCRDVLYTDGVKHVAEKGGAYWLIDKIATLQALPLVRVQEFQTWKLFVNDSRAKLTCDDGNGNIVHSEKIDYTDFPLDEIAMWVQFDGENRTILLPSEY
ncbi:DUF6876 family protein [Bradyrhizobium sp. SZCCHNRI2010]|uniref:DUF6876 family protein n=1 Tax=Bradyrhizobium sp. SZCCHNRI2010 TaxID=3057283 RepID=UPI0028E89D46|nr:DUF6876 family protein [Bradyrhizobium sp. SZCCHNRI2010]